MLFVVTCTLSAQNQPVLVESYRFGDFTSANAIALDQFGHIYVSDGEACTVSLFNLKGMKEMEVGSPGWKETQFYNPMGIDATLGIAIYVADRDNHRIMRLDRNLIYQSSFTTKTDPTREVEFGFPLDVVNTEFEELFILDGENQRVLSVTGFDMISNTFGGIESGRGRLQDPIAMCTDGRKTLYILERERIVAFDIFGNFKFDFGSGELNEARGITMSGEQVLAVTAESIVLFSAEGAHTQTWDQTSMVFSSPVKEFRDAALIGKFLLLLTDENVIIFPVDEVD